MPIRFHLDENVHEAVAAGLRRRGINVTTAEDASLLGAADEQHLAFAIQEGRVIVTQDRDFLRMNRRGVPHPGIVFAHSERTSIGQLVQALTLIDNIATPDDMRGQVEFI